MFQYIGDIYHKFCQFEKYCLYPQEKEILLRPSPRHVIVFWHSPFTDVAIYMPIFTIIFRYDDATALYMLQMLRLSGDEGYVVYESSLEQCEHRVSLIDMLIAKYPQPTFSYYIRKN